MDLQTGAKTVVVSCPFCRTMMSDGVADADSEAQVKDIAELLADLIIEHPDPCQPN